MNGKLNKNKWIALCVAVVCCMTVGLAYGMDDKLNGLITARNGEQLTMQTQGSGNVVVVLTDSTKVEEPEGKLHMRHKEMGVTALVPGLSIEVKGTKNAKGQVVANEIKFSAKNLQTAQEIQAGLKPTEKQVQANQATDQREIAGNQQRIESDEGKIQSNQQQIQANQATDQRQIQQVNKRFSDLSDYDVKETADVYFPVGKSEISEKDKSALHQLANGAVNLTGYIVQVKGFADSSGNPVQNQKLSMERADAVVAYLEQVGNIPLRHIVAPGAMGTADPAASNESAQGRAENRRVEVKVLVNRGLAEK